MTIFACPPGYNDGMEVIYVDSLFLINIVINYLILLATGRINSFRLRRGRYALGAALGAAYSVLVVVPGFEFLAVPLMKAVVAGLMLLISFGGEERLLRAGVVFLMVSAAFGGAVYAVSMLGGMPRGNMPYVPVSMRVLALSFAIVYAAVTLVFRRSASRAERSVHTVEISLLGGTVEVRALRDTGNTLNDPASGKRVMIIETRRLLPLLPSEVGGLLSAEERPGGAELFEILEGVPELKGRLRLIPYSSVGVELSLLLAIRPDKILVDGTGGEELLVALSPTPVGDGVDFEALI